MWQQRTFSRTSEWFILKKKARPPRALLARGCAFFAAKRGLAFVEIP